MGYFKKDKDGKTQYISWNMGKVIQYFTIGTIIVFGLMVMILYSITAMLQEDVGKLRYQLKITEDSFQTQSKMLNSALEDARFYKVKSQRLENIIQIRDKEDEKIFKKCEELKQTNKTKHKKTIKF